MNKQEPIEVFFTQPVFTSLAEGELANGSSDLAGLAAELIDSASSSVDLCAYSLTHMDVADALQQAWEGRGIEVRVITERDNRDTAAMEQLEEAGIQVIDDTFGSNDGSGIMHNKFLIIDCRGDSDPDNDVLWTGSYNFSYSGTEDNAENAVVFRSSDIASAYTLEFDEMWGSETITPDSGASRFGTRKKDDTPHDFTVGGVSVEAYMAPSDGTNDKILSNINTSTGGLLLSIYSFTRDDLSGEMKENRDGIPGYYVEGVFDSLMVDQWSEYYDLKGLPGGDDPWDPPAEVYLAKIHPEDGAFHHKYMIIDSRNGGDVRVIAGSANWSSSAAFWNDENIVIIHSDEVAGLFEQEFAARFAEASGEDFPIYDLQFTEDPSGDSPFEDRTVHIEGVVTGNFEDDNQVFIANPEGGPWSAIALYDSPVQPERGDLVVVSGEVSEYEGFTEIKNITSLDIISEEEEPRPHTPNTAECGAEEYEGVLLEVRDVVVTNEDLGWGEWEVDDGSGPLVINDLGDYSYIPQDGDTLEVVRGVLNYSFGNFKLEPRDDEDFLPLSVDDAGSENSAPRSEKPGLLPNYPNPFNPQTVIPIELNKRSSVILGIYNIEGKMVKTLHQGELEAGTYRFEWDGLTSTGGPAAGGVYICLLKEEISGDRSIIAGTVKMVLLK